MLDERWEYKQYTTESTLLNDNNYEKGFSHALTIIARHELEERDYWEISREEKKKAREEVYKTLQIWCFEEKCDYMTTLFGHIKDTKKQKQFDDFIKKYNTERSLLSPDIYNPAYNLNKASFLRIIANAISLGPLKVKKLGCNRQLFDDLYSGRIIFVGDKNEVPCLKVLYDKKTKTVAPREDNIPRTKILFQIISSYLSVCELTEAYGEPLYLNKIEIDHMNMGNKSYLYKYYEVIHTNVPGLTIPLSYSSEINTRKAKKGKREKAWIVKNNFLDYYEIKTEPYDGKEKEFIKENRCYIYEINGEIEFPSLEDFPDIQNKIIQEKQEEEQRKKEAQKEKKKLKKNNQ